MRKPEWPELLAAYVEAAMKRDFQYGAYDCCLLAADWVLEATGVDHAGELRGYKSMLEAYKIIARYGSMEAMVTQLLGTDPIHVAFAQRGDLVLIARHPALGGMPECMGICLGRTSAFPREKGLMMIPTLEATAGWKIR